MRLHDNAPERQYFTNDGRLTDYAVSEYAKLRLEDREEEMPEQVLDLIMTDAKTADRVIMKVRQYRSIKQQKRNAALRTVYAAAAVVSILALFGAAFYMLNSDRKTDVDKPQIAGQESVSPLPEIKSDDAIHEDEDVHESRSLQQSETDSVSPPHRRPSPPHTATASTLTESQSVSTEARSAAPAAVSSEVKPDQKKLMAYQESRYDFEDADVFERALTNFKSSVRSLGAAPAPNTHELQSAHFPQHNAVVWDKALKFSWETKPNEVFDKEQFRITIKQKGRPNRHILCDGPPCYPSTEILASMSPGLYYWDVHDLKSGVVVSDKFKYYRSDVAPPVGG